MKKIIIMVAVVFVAVAAQAQVPNVEVQMADAGFKAFAPAKKNSSVVSNSSAIQNKVERAVAQKVAQEQQSNKNCFLRDVVMYMYCAPYVAACDIASCAEALAKKASAEDTTAAPQKPAEKPCSKNKGKGDGSAKDSASTPTKSDLAAQLVYPAVLPYK